MKNVTWGILFILSAIILALNALGVNFGLPESISVWKIILAIALIIFIIDQIVRKNFTVLFFPLIFIIMIFEKEIAIYLLNKPNGEIASTWTFLLIAILLTAGFSLVFSKFSFTYKKGGKEYVFTGKEAKKKFKEVTQENSVYYIDCSTRVDKDIEVNMGKAEIYFTNTKLYDGQGVINLDNNLGKVIFYIPENWAVDCEIDNSLAHVKSFKPKEYVANQKHITIKGENNLGNVEFISVETSEDEICD